MTSRRILQTHLNDLVPKAERRPLTLPTRASAPPNTVSLAELLTKLQASSSNVLADLQLDPEDIEMLTRLKE